MSVFETSIHKPISRLRRQPPETNPAVLARDMEPSGFDRFTSTPGEQGLVEASMM